MEALVSSAAWAASAALIGVTLIPLTIFWAFNLCGKRFQHQPRPLKLTRIFLHMALPTFILAVTTAIVNPAVIAGAFTDITAPRYSWGTTLAGFYASLTSAFLTTAAGVIASQAVYLSGLCVWYLVLAKQKWWSVVQLDTVCATGLLVVLDIAWFAKEISDFVTNNVDSKVRLIWLIVMIDLTLCLVAALNVGVAIYCATKLKKRGDLAVGNLSSLLLAASFLWLLRCSFLLAVDLKGATQDWTKPEWSLQKILYPILDYWVSATVLGLVTFILRNPVWSDPSVFSDRSHWQQQQVHAQYEGHYPTPPYGQHQEQQQQPHVYEHEDPHKYYQQQPSTYRQ